MHNWLRGMDASGFAFERHLGLKANTIRVKQCYNQMNSPIIKCWLQTPQQIGFKSPGPREETNALAVSSPVEMTTCAAQHGAK